MADCTSVSTFSGVLYSSHEFGQKSAPLSQAPLTNEGRVGSHNSCQFSPALGYGQKLMSSTFLRVWQPKHFAPTCQKVGSKLKRPGTGVDSQRLSGSGHYPRGQILNKLVELISNDRLADPDDIPIKPGEKLILKIPEQQAQGFEGRISNGEIPAVTKVVLDTQAVNFGDGTGFLGGKPARRKISRQTSRTSPLSMTIFAFC